MAPTGIMLDMALKQGENILLEGAQGCLLDIDSRDLSLRDLFGHQSGQCDPWCRNSSRTRRKTYGVVKAYTTRVGEGPFPTELYDGKGMSDPDGKHMADVDMNLGQQPGAQGAVVGWIWSFYVMHIV